MSADVGQRVARCRIKAEMTVQALADRCKDLGLPLDRTVITKLEKGRRQSVTVPELLVLARALRVSPLALIFPVGQADTIEVLPSTPMAPFQAAQWFSGERPWPGTDGTEDPEADWWAGSFALIAYREHAKLVDDHRVALRAAGNYRQTATVMPEGERQPYLQHAETLEREAADIERKLGGVRKAMRDRGVTPPPLPAHMEHVDYPNGDQVAAYDLSTPGSRDVLDSR